MEFKYMGGRKPTQKALEIIDLVKRGEVFSDLVKMGYKAEIAKYYIRKIRYPTQFKKFVKTIKLYNAKRRDV